MATKEQIARAGEFRRTRVPMDKWMTCAQVDELMADFAEAEASAAQNPPSDPEQLARRFHETYERLAPSFGYETRKASAKPWSEVPENNRKLMIAVCAEILGAAQSAVPAATQVLPDLIPRASVWTAPKESAVPAAAPELSIPMVIDGVTGPKGAYGVRRFRTEGTVDIAEYWNLGKWLAVCYVFKDKELADCVRDLLVSVRTAPKEGK